jgi:hypothetical protein
MKTEEDFFLEESKKEEEKRKINEIMRTSFNKEYYQLINWNASIIQNKFRKFMLKKKREMRLIPR